MANLSQAQIESLARSAGMANPQIMAAIAMAESSGNPKAHNPMPPDNSYGLWQINMYGNLGPARRKQYGISSNSALFNPAVNARAAAKILSGQGLSAWSTYTNGAYKKYMGKSTGATQAGYWDEFWDNFWEGPLETDPEDPNYFESPQDQLGIDQLGGSVTDIAKLTVNAAEWMSNPRNWLNVVYVLVGGVVVVATLSATVRSQVIGQAKSIVGKVGKA